MDEIKHLSWTAGLLAYLDPEITERPAPPLTYTEAIKNSEAQIAAAWRLRNQDDGGPPETEKYLAETDTANNLIAWPQDEDRAVAEILREKDYRIYSDLTSMSLWLEKANEIVRNAELGPRLAAYRLTFRRAKIRASISRATGGRVQKAADVVGAGISISRSFAPPLSLGAAIIIPLRRAKHIVRDPARDLHPEVLAVWKQDAGTFRMLLMEHIETWRGCLTHYLARKLGSWGWSDETLAEWAGSTG